MRVLVVFDQHAGNGRTYRKQMVADFIESHSNPRQNVYSLRPKAGTVVVPLEDVVSQTRSARDISLPKSVKA